MPRFNLKDEEMNPEGGAPEGLKNPMPPTLREVGGSSGRLSPIFLVLLIIVVLGAGVFALNYFKVIHLWGKKAPVVTETLPEPDFPPMEEPTVTETVPEVTPPPAKPAIQERATPARELGIVSTGTGKFTVQFSAWTSRAKAEDQSSRLSSGGFDSYIDEATSSGVRWYQVRVGRYDTRAQAREVANRLQVMVEDDVWLTTPRAK